MGNSSEMKDLYIKYPPNDTCSPKSNIIEIVNYFPAIDSGIYVGAYPVQREIDVQAKIKYSIPVDASSPSYKLFIRNQYCGQNESYYKAAENYTPLIVGPGDSGEVDVSFTAKYYGVFSDFYDNCRNNGVMPIYFYFSDYDGAFSIYDEPTENNSFINNYIKIEYPVVYSP